MASGLTEKQMSDKRFKKSEEEIFEAIFDQDNLPDVNLVAKKTKLSRSTLYRHHKVLYNITTDYEKYILRKFSCVMRCATFGRRVKLKNVFYKMLVFIMNHKKIIKALIKRNRTTIFEKMLERLKGRIIKSCNLPKNSEKIFKVYTMEVVGVIEEWGEKDFCQEEIERVLSDIMYLTDTIKTRLMPLSE